MTSVKDTEGFFKNMVVALLVPRFQQCVAHIHAVKCIRHPSRACLTRHYHHNQYNRQQLAWKVSSSTWISTSRTSTMKRSFQSAQSEQSAQSVQSTQSQSQSQSQSAIEEVARKIIIHQFRKRRTRKQGRRKNLPLTTKDRIRLLKLKTKNPNPLHLAKHTAHKAANFVVTRLEKTQTWIRAFWKDTKRGEINAQRAPMDRWWWAWNIALALSPAAMIAIYMEFRGIPLVQERLKEMELYRKAKVNELYNYHEDDDDDDDDDDNYNTIADNHHDNSPSNAPTTSSSTSIPSSVSAGSTPIAIGTKESDCHDATNANPAPTIPTTSSFFSFLKGRNTITPSSSSEKSSKLQTIDTKPDSTTFQPASASDTETKSPEANVDITRTVQELSNRIQALEKELKKQKRNLEKDRRNAHTRMNQSGIRNRIEERMQWKSLSEQQGEEQQHQQQQQQPHQSPHNSETTAPTMITLLQHSIKQNMESQWDKVQQKGRSWVHSILSVEPSSSSSSSSHSSSSLPTQETESDSMSKVSIPIMQQTNDPVLRNVKPT